MAVNDLASVTEDMVMKDIVEKKSTNKLKLWINENWRAILAEFISTLLLLLLGCMCCIPIDGLQSNPPAYGPIGFGLVVLVNIQAFGHISGAHMNPSITLAGVICGKISLVLGMVYFVAQCLGAFIGYGILVALSPSDFSSEGICTTQPLAKYTASQAMGLEIVLTAALVVTACASWDPVNNGINETASLKFGLIIIALSLAGGPLTGASMNSARTLAPAIWTNTWNSHWIYWAGPLLGAAGAAVFYRCIWMTSDNTRKSREVIWKEIPQGPV